MKVMHVLNTGGYSGAENIVISIIRKNQKLGYESVYVSPTGKINEKLNEEKIKHLELKNMNVIELKRIIRKFNPDVIHAHDFRASIISSFTLTNKPIISHIHNNSPWIKKFGIKSLLYLLSSINYKKILIVSKSIQDEYIFAPQIKNKLVLIKNFVDDIIVKEKSKKETNNKNYDVIFIGRLADEKDPIRFIKLVTELKKEKEDITVAIVGDGYLKEDIVKEINKSNLQKNIDMLGFCDNPYSILKKSKILCMTSKYEGYGLVAVEAMILNKPVVATKVGGIPDIVDDSCGKICTEDKDFVIEITKLLKEESYYKQKVDNIQSKLSNINNSDNYIKDLDKIYHSVAK